MIIKLMKIFENSKIEMNVAINDQMELSHE
jgi:hypothetical protein